MSAYSEELRVELEACRVVAIVRDATASPSELRGIVECLVTVGLPLVELPLTNPATLEAIRLSADIGGAFLGAGTVLTTADVDAVADAGARYIVTPVLNLEVLKHAIERGLGTIPGTFSPTEIVTALERGATAAKVFPGGVVGPEFVRALSAPFPNLALVPTGGVSVADAGRYIAAGALAVGLGGDLIGDGSAAHISRQASVLRATIPGRRERAS